MDRRNKFEIKKYNDTFTNNGKWMVRKGGRPLGFVEQTKGGFYRAYNYKESMGVGPFFSFLRAVRFTTKGIYRVSVENRAKFKGGAWAGRTGDPDSKVWFPTVKGAENYLSNIVGKRDPVGLANGDYYIDDMSVEA